MKRRLSIAITSALLLVGAMAMPAAAQQQDTGEEEVFPVPTNRCAVAVADAYEDLDPEVSTVYEDFLVRENGSRLPTPQLAQTLADLVNDGTILPFQCSDYEVAVLPIPPQEPPTEPPGPPTEPPGPPTQPPGPPTPPDVDVGGEAEELPEPEQVTPPQAERPEPPEVMGVSLVRTGADVLVLLTSALALFGIGFLALRRTRSGLSDDA